MRSIATDRDLTFPVHLADARGTPGAAWICGDTGSGPGGGSVTMRAMAGAAAAVTGLCTALAAGGGARAPPGPPPPGARLGPHALPRHPAVLRGRLPPQT